VLPLPARFRRRERVMDEFPAAVFTAPDQHQIVGMGCVRLGAQQQAGQREAGAEVKLEDLQSAMHGAGI